MPYMNVNEVESALIALASAYPTVCELITLPYPTFEGRTCHALRVGKGTAAGCNTLMITAGVHAREWGSCEIAVNLAADLCEAYTSNSGLAYGGKNFASAKIKTIMENLNLVIFADVNPDGRNFSQTSDAMWRKNRNTAWSGGHPEKIGVDLNRNQDFLWDFPTYFDSTADVMTSTDPASSTYHGPAATSEQETKNVVWLMDSYPRTHWYLDLHSYAKDILYNWGDDENQTSDPNKNFLNPAYNGQRGKSGDTYAEYIPTSDLTQEQELANSFHDALQVVRGENYTIMPAFQLYATSGANNDYSYARHYIDPLKNKMYGYTIEWGTEFMPPWTEMENIIADVCAGLVSFCLVALCQSDSGPMLQTPSVMFNDIPEGETDARAIVFQVTSCSAATFQIVSGPAVISGSGGFGTLPSPSATLPAIASAAPRNARLWLTFTGTNAGDISAGTVTVRHVESGQTWSVAITANTLARPTVAAVMLLDQSGSMTEPSGIPSQPTRNDVLQFAAPTFVNLLQEHNGVGVIDFDHAAYPRMPVQTTGPAGPFEPTRAAALAAIQHHTPNLNGMTSIGNGVEAAHTMLAATSGYDDSAIVVFTDGFENTYKYLSDVAPLINNRVYAIGLGTADQIRPAALTALTNGTGGYLLLTGQIGPDDLFRLSKYYLQILAEVTNQDIVLDSEGALRPGNRVHIPFQLNEADISMDAIVLGEADIPLFRFYLETPAGDIIAPSSVGAVTSVQYVQVQGMSFYRISLPVPLRTGVGTGRWYGLLEVDESCYQRYLSKLSDQQDRHEYERVKAHGVSYGLNVQSWSGLRMQGSLQQSSQEPGANLNLRGVLTEYGLPVGSNRAKVQAELERPDRTKTVATLTEEDWGSGIYTTRITAPIPGVYHFRMLSEGYSLRGRPFTREQILTGAVWKGGDTPPPSGKGNGHGKSCCYMPCLFADSLAGNYIATPQPNPPG
jgi:murein tripeptide amidase MpaA